MNAITLYNIVGLSNPYTIYVCDVYGNNCILLATVSTTVPPYNQIILPQQFNTAPSVGIKVVTSDGCEIFRVINCFELLYKQFQDFEDFEFMDGIIYDFEY
jgi:hypothetical protein